MHTKITSKTDPKVRQAQRGAAVDGHRRVPLQLALGSCDGMTRSRALARCSHLPSFPVCIGVNLRCRSRCHGATDSPFCVTYVWVTTFPRRLRNFNKQRCVCTRTTCNLNHLGFVSCGIQFTNLCDRYSTK